MKPNTCIAWAASQPTASSPIERVVAFCRLPKEIKLKNAARHSRYAGPGNPQNVADYTSKLKAAGQKFRASVHSKKMDDQRMNHVGKKKGHVRQTSEGHFLGPILPMPMPNNVSPAQVVQMAALLNTSSLQSLRGF